MIGFLPLEKLSDPAPPTGVSTLGIHFQLDCVITQLPEWDVDRLLWDTFIWNFGQRLFELHILK